LHPIHPMDSLLIRVGADLQRLIIVDEH
jgi:hypothetical protein